MYAIYYREGGQDEFICAAWTSWGAHRIRKRLRREVLRQIEWQYNAPAPGDYVILEVTR